MPFGRAPVLEVDGTRIAGSMNILRHLGAKSSSGMELKVMGSRDGQLTDFAY